MSSRELDSPDLAADSHTFQPGTHTLQLIVVDSNGLTAGLSADAFGPAFRAELEAIRRDASRPGSALNRLLVP